MSSAVAARLASDPVLCGLTLQETLRHRVGSHSVHLVEYEGRTAYLKLFEGKFPQAQAQAVIAATAFAAERLHLSNGLNAAPHILLARPLVGAVVFAQAAGQQLSLLLASAPTPQRNRLITRAGQWLEALTCPADSAVFAPYFWLKHIQKAARQTDPQADIPMITRHLSALGRFAERLRGATVLRARSHGDFTPDNLFLQGKVMTAIDMPQSDTMPIARDLARFLVWLHSRRSGIPKNTKSGVSYNDYIFLTKVFKSKHQDQAPILRFMIGVMLAEIYLDSPGRIRRRHLLACAMVAWQHEG